MTRRWLSLLGGPRGPLALAAVALLLSLPSVALGPVLDDHGFRRRLLVDARGPGATFCLGGDSQFGAHGTWWFEPRPRGWCFLRPLSGLTHWLDFALWPDAVWWMRLENCLIYAALAALAAICYARLSGPGLAAGLGGLMYAVNDAHAHSLGMIAGRNTLLYAAFGLLALLAHVAYRTTARRAYLALAASAFACALLSGEGGIGALGYLAAYALLLDRGPAAERVRSLLPYASVAALWAIAYAAGDYGARDAQFYRDPRTDPGGTLAAGLLDLPVWLGTQLGVGYATASFEAPVALVRLVSAALTVLLAAVLWPTLRESRVARFYAAGLLFSLAPLLLTTPQDRLLVLSSFGGFGLLACFLERAARSSLERIARPCLIAIHLGIAPLAFVSGYLLIAGVTRAEAKVDEALPHGDAAARTGVVIVRAPLIGSLPYALSKRRANAQTLPRYSYELYAAPSALELARVDATTLELAPEGGYCSSRSECIGSDLSAFRAGQQVAMTFMRVEVLELTARGTPRRVRFHFPSPLEDPTRRWLIWTAHGVEPFTPPPPGRTIRLPGLSRLAAVR